MSPRVPLARKSVTTLVLHQTACDLFIGQKTASRQLSSRGKCRRRLVHAFGGSQSRLLSLPSLRQPSLSSPSPQPSQTRTRRRASTLVSQTAINSPANVPDANRDLYASLERLKHTAADYVSQSRLQLALRGLESATPTLRIGLLGIGNDGNAAARKLARVLLADALGDETQWEQVLVNGQANDGKALLLKYGAEDDMAPLNPLVETMTVPSRLLQKHNIEILITRFNTDAVPTADPAGLVDAVLVPPLQTPVASTGRTGFVRFPVHRAIVVGEGIEGCIDFGRLAAAVKDTVLAQSGLIQVALSLPRDGSRSVQEQSASEVVSAIDIEQASSALSVFRQDVANGPLFSVKWKASNIESIKSSIVSDSISSTSPDANTTLTLRPAIVHHIRSTLDSANAAITTAELTAHATKLAKTIPDTTRANLQAAVSNWSQHAHTDLQLSLATALASRSWRRTSWSRLLWRVDDVGVAAEAVLRNHWLLDAEAGLAFLAGRVEQAGFFASRAAGANWNPDYALHRNDRAVTKSGEQVAVERAYLSAPTPTTTFTPVVKDATKTGLFERFFSNKIRTPTTAELLQTNVLIQKVTEEGGIDVFHSRPWPLAIHFTRQKLLHTLVPALQSRAQTLLFSALSTIGGTSALGAWIWVATKGASLAEAGAVAALGLVWSIRRLQKKWEHERGVWEGEVTEAGRVVLAEVEESMRKVVRENERPHLRSEDVQLWTAARGALREVEDALQKRL